MSSKRERKTWSLSARLFAWYSTATALLASVTIGSVYFAMAVQLDKEADAWLLESAKYIEDHLHEQSSEPDLWSITLARVVDSSGQVVFSSPQLLRLFSIDDFPMEGLTGTDRMGSDGRTYRLLNVKRGHRRFLIAQGREFEKEFVASFRRNIMIAAVPCLAISLVIGYVVAQMGMRPIKAIISAARAVSPLHLQGRVPVEGQPSDLRELAETLNAVLEKMEDAFGRLDAFSTDVAHELRTPVQNLRGSIEVALSQDRPADAYRQTLLVSLNEVDRLARLVDRLLLLAQAQDPRREVRREPTDVGSELEDIREFFTPTATESGITIQVQSDVDREVSLERSLFQRAASNLVANAITHTPTGGTVSLRARVDQNMLWVEVADTGVGIDEAELPYLFDRFYRSVSVRSSGRGVGIGLAIVKRVVDLHGGRVKINSKPGLGTNVEMAFPI